MGPEMGTIAVIICCNVVRMSESFVIWPVLVVGGMDKVDLGPAKGEAEQPCRGVSLRGCEGGGRH